MQTPFYSYWDYIVFFIRSENRDAGSVRNRKRKTSGFCDITQLVTVGQRGVHFCIARLTLIVFERVPEDSRVGGLVQRQTRVNVIIDCVPIHGSAVALLVEHDAVLAVIVHLSRKEFVGSGRERRV